MGQRKGQIDKKGDTVSTLLLNLTHDAMRNDLRGEKMESIGKLTRGLNDEIQQGGMTVLDSTGQPLIKTGMYKLNGETVSIIREKYGAGNPMDTFYWVYFRRSNNKEDLLCVEQNGGGFRSGYTYTSRFEPITK